MVDDRFFRISTAGEQRHHTFAYADARGGHPAGAASQPDEADDA